MYEGLMDYQKIDLNNLKPIGYDRKDMSEYYQKTINSLNEVKPYLDKIYDVSLVVKLHAGLNTLGNEYLKEFIDFINALESEEPNIPTNQFLNKKNNLLQRLNTWIQQCLEVSQHNRFLLVFNSIVSQRPENLNESVLKQIKNEFNNLVEDTKREKETLVREINDLKARAGTTLTEIQDKSATTLVSNYAKVFEDEAKLNKQTATNWLIFAIALSAISISLLILIFIEGWFTSSEKIITATKTYYIYDISKMLTKYLIISILIFITTYCFKKYSVYKHLQTINKHRQNALNSYLLLSESIIGNDEATRNNLMLQVAKAIYEHTATGFLSSKQDDGSGSGIIEITKVLGNKNIQ